MKDYMHTGIICGTQVSSRASYVVYGRVRGLVAPECRSFEAAAALLSAISSVARHKAAILMPLSTHGA